MFLRKNKMHRIYIYPKEISLRNKTAEQEEITRKKIIAEGCLLLKVSLIKRSSSQLV